MYGDGVNVAARIEGVATTNQVVVSEDVYRLIRNRSAYNPQSIGEHMLKGVEKPATLYVLARPGETIAAPQAMAATAATVGVGQTTASDRSHRKAVAVGTIAGVTGFVVLSVFVAWSTNVVELGSDGVGGDAAGHRQSRGRRGTSSPRRLQPPPRPAPRVELRSMRPDRQPVPTLRHPWKSPPERWPSQHPRAETPIEPE